MKYFHSQFQIDTYKNWFSEMISYPCKKELSRLEKFTVFSATTFYIPTGLFMLLLPSEGCMQGGLMTQKQCREVQGFFRIAGIQVFTIAFLYIIFSRANSRISSHNIILGTVFSRTLYAAMGLYLLYIRTYISLVTFCIGLTMDIGLSLATLSFWATLPNDKAAQGFLQSVWDLLRPSNTSLNKSSVVVHLLGYVQTILGLLALVFPTAALEVLCVNSRALNGPTMGSICLGFLPSAAIGFIHVLAGGADSRSFNIAAVFYRVFITMPLMAFISGKREIPSGLALYYIIIDGVFALFVFITLLIESKKLKKQ